MCAGSPERTSAGSSAGSLLALGRRVLSGSRPLGRLNQVAYTLTCPWTRRSGPCSLPPSWRAWQLSVWIEALGQLWRCQCPDRTPGGLGSVKLGQGHTAFNGAFPARTTPPPPSLPGSKEGGSQSSPPPFLNPSGVQKFGVQIFCDFRKITFILPPSTEYFTPLYGVFYPPLRSNLT